VTPTTSDSPTKAGNQQQQYQLHQYTYYNPAKFQEETIRSTQVSILSSEIIENLSAL
jgi:hypothetical protein